MLHTQQTDRWNDVIMHFRSQAKDYHPNVGYSSHGESVLQLTRPLSKINFQLPFCTTMYFKRIHVLKIRNMMIT